MNKSNSPENRSFTSFAANRWPENGAGMMSVNMFRWVGSDTNVCIWKRGQPKPIKTQPQWRKQCRPKQSFLRQSSLTLETVSICVTCLALEMEFTFACTRSGMVEGFKTKWHHFFDSCTFKGSMENYWRIPTLKDVHCVQTTAQSKAPMHQSWILMTGSIVLTADVAVGKICMFWSCFVIGFRACQESASKNGLVMRGNMRGVGHSCCGKNDQKCVACYMFSSLTGNPWALDQWISREKQAFLWLQGFLKCRPTCWGPSDYEALPMSDAIFIHTWMLLRLQRFWFQCQFNFGLASTLNHSPVWRSFTWQSIACFFVLWRVVPAVQKNSHDVMMCWEIGAFFAFVEHRLWDHQPRRTSWTPTGF